MSTSTSTTKTFIVPVNVQALKIAYSDTTEGLFKWPEFYFPAMSTAQGNTSSIAVGPEVVQPLSGKNAGNNNIISNNNDGQDAGIRLHWALPDAVVKGRIGNESSNSAPNKIEFPKFPNRWLVTGYYHDNSNNTNSIKQWIIESDALEAQQGDEPQKLHTVEVPNPVVLDNYTMGKKPYGLWIDSSSDGPAYNAQLNYLGKAISDISSWKESGAPNQLEATSIFGPTFTAYYLHSANSFGFFDHLDGFQLDNCDLNVTYQIIGWYNKAEDDIAAITFAAAKTAYNNYVKKYQKSAGLMSQLEYIPYYFEENLQWKFADAYEAKYDNTPYAFSTMPSQCTSIYNGMLVGLPYKTTDSNKYISKLSSNSINIALGNNTSEAISSLLVNNDKFPIRKDAPSTPDPKNPYPKLETKADLEYLLNAFQEDLLRRLGPSNVSHRIEQLENMLHQLRFSRYPGGQAWMVRAKSNVGSQTPTADANEVQLPLAGAQALSILNEYQAAYDEKVRSIDTIRQQIFMDWMNNAYRFNEAGSDISTDDASFLMAEITSWFILQAETGVLSVKNQADITSAANSGAKNISYTMSFTPQMTVSNTTIDEYILGSGKAISAVLQQPMSDPGTIGLGELNIAIGVLLPDILNDLTALLNALSNKVNQHGSALSILLNKNIVNQLTQYQNLLNNIGTLLDNTSIKAQLKRLTAALQTQNNDLTTLNNTLKQYADTMSNGNTSISDFYNTLTGEDGILNDSDDSMQPVLSQSKYNGIYDIQTAIVCLELFSSAFAADISKTNVGYGYVVESWSRANSAQAAVKDIISAFSDVDKGIQTDGVLSMVKSFTNTLATALGTLLKDKTADSLAQALSDSKISTDDQNKIDQWISDNYSVCKSLLASLPAGHQVVTATKLMNDVTTALQEEVLLQAHKAPAFNQPNEPVIALSEPNSDDTLLLRRVNRNGLSKNLPCRDTSNILTSVEVKSKTISVPEGTFNLPSGLSSNTTLVDLLNEGYMLAPQNSHLTGELTKLIDDYATAQENQAIPPVWKDENKDEVRFTGTLPYYTSLNVGTDANPFLPLFLSWEVDFIPIEMNTSPDNDKATIAYQSDIVFSNSGTSNFKFNGSDLEPAQRLSLSSKAINFSGQMLLSDGGNYSLTHQISLYFKHKWNIDLSKITPTQIGKFTALQSELYQTYLYFTKDLVLTQGLNGFNAALLERIQGYQFSFNYSGNQQNFTDGTQLLAYFKELWDSDNPNWKSFNPITKSQNIINSVSFSPLRAGVFSIDKLAVVDVFGRFVEIDLSNINIAQSLKLPKDGDLGDKAGSAYMAPRFVHPSRLRFLWTSAQSLSHTAFQEYNSNPAYSPVCGWIMPNHLDNSMYLYDVSGDTLGYFETPESAEALVWRSKPQSDGGGDNNLSNDIKGANTYLVQFINDFLSKLTGSSGGTAATFSDAILKSNKYLLAPGLRETPAMAVIKGRALVLAQAQIRLEMYGQHAVSINQSALSNANKNYNGSLPSDDLSVDTQQLMDITITKNPDEVPSSYPVYEQVQRNSAGIETVNIPVVIGHDKYLNDGLVGYFINGDFSTFYAVTDIPEQTANGITIKSAQPLLMNFKDNNTVNLTMVMDPRTPVHATSGMLPETSVQIPNDEYQKAMNNLKVYLNVTPILLGSKELQDQTRVINYEFPLPKEVGYNWSWVQTSLKQDEALTPNTLNDKAKWNIYPLQIQDGWLKMSKTEED